MTHATGLVQRPRAASRSSWASWCPGKRWYWAVGATWWIFVNTASRG
ncbi:hypothetical protein [Streptomyces echinatus]